MAKDKKLHLIAGFIITITTTWINLYLAFSLVLIAGIGKEVYDYYNQDSHTPELMDAIYTILGGCIGVLITSLIQYSFN